MDEVSEAAPSYDPLVTLPWRLCSIRYTGQSSSA